ncbi:hypothetical protein N0V90_002106 [Kalmusia sp. IMI 367209]|nr:hypothetical protein N0V90_002106 [Kalmusia sp. IMI 367209]
MAENGFRALARDMLGQSAALRTFTAAVKSTGKERGWVTPTPSREFQKFSQKTQTFPTYLNTDELDGPILVLNDATFAVPRMPYGEKFSHDQIPDCNICETCEEVDIRNLLTHGNGRRYKMGWADRIISCTSCALCRIITAALEYETKHGYAVEFGNFEDDSYLPDENLIKKPSRCFVILTSLGSSYPLRTGKSRAYHIYCYFLHWSTSAVLGQSVVRLLDQDAAKMGKSTLFCSRLTDPAKANMKLARSWLFECDHRHDCLFRETKKSQIENLIVIDVRQNCLVELPVGAIYMALSYVWPKLESNVFQLKKDDLGSFKTPGIFLKMHDKLPRAIKDALQIVRELDETYLWIDALCIVQNDPEMKMKLISRMHDVYGGAYLTIVAATSTSQTEDYAIPGIGTSRQRQQFVETVEGLRLITAYPDYNQSLEQSRWATRGWTFQEGLLSKRCLMFTDHQMYFRCTRDARCEDVVTEPGTEEFQSHPAKPRLRESKVDYLLNSEFLQATKDQDWFSEYVHVVANYTKREMSFDTDINNGFTGIMNKLSPYFDGTGFMSGHPFARFEKSLLWYPTSKARRRGVIVKSGYDYGFPSWSWMGYVGGVNFENERPGLVPTLDAHLPTVQWFRWSEYGLVPVRDSWHKYQPPRDDSSNAFEMALLWSRAHFLRKNPARIITWGSVIRTSLQLPENFIAEWVTDWEQSLPCFIIKDADADACGFLPSVDRTWAEKYKNEGGGECQFLTLSITQRSRDDLRSGEHLLHKKYQKTNDEPGHFLHVMLVEFIDEEIAERRGVGLLHTSAVNWNNLLDVERRIVILG